MDITKIQNELKKIESSSFAQKSDKQLMSYEILSELHENQYQGIQPLALEENIIRISMVKKDWQLNMGYQFL